ncbi:MAG: hypothetical protein QM808_04600 [Steroidobacteraceae bacterium]
MKRTSQLLKSLLVTVMGVLPGMPLASHAQTADFSESWAAYQTMKARADGGKPIKWDKLPDWSGVWTGSGSGLPNYMIGSDGQLTVRGGSAASSKQPAPLTPEYQTKVRKVLADRAKGIEWDYISNCIPAGFPRWASSHFLKEFAVTPNTVWMLNEEQSEVRRVYTDGREHTPRDEAYALFEGDSVGFWDGDTLVVHTVDNKVGTWDRSGSAYSDQVNTIERIRKISKDVIEDQMTVYDKLSLSKPWQVTFQFTRVTEPADLRIRMWSCNENNNVVQDESGGSRHVLPGEAGYKDPNQLAEPARQ